MWVAFLLALLQTASVDPGVLPAAARPSVKGSQELTIDDARIVLEAQRKKLFHWNDTHRLASESLKAQRLAEQADRELDILLDQLRDKYDCKRCELMFDMKWTKPPAPPVAEVK